MNITLAFESYIANPYWPQANALIDIQKKSGMNRARSEDKKDSALLKYLEKINMPLAQYKQIEEEASKPWYTNSEGLIIIPSLHLMSSLVNATYNQPPAGAKIPSNQLRSLLKVSDFTTTKTQADTKFERFVLLKDGKGNVISNQRSFASDEVIKDFDATGTITFDEGDLKPATVLALFRYTGKYIGCGSSRKMGYGRFIVKE